MYVSYNVYVVICWVFLELSFLGPYISFLAVFPSITINQLGYDVKWA